MSDDYEATDKAQKEASTDGSKALVVVVDDGEDAADEPPLVTEVAG
jgi:hypothetical protein